MRSLAALVRAAVLAGLIAGAAAAGFHWFFTEPVIERAIKTEDLARAPEKQPTKEVVSRRTQQLGLILGFLLYGGVCGLLFGALYRLLHPWVPAWNDARGGFVVALILGWSISLFPFLKYPANPPGVGEAETIGYRQALYLAFMGFTLIGTLAAFWFQRRLSRRGWGWPIALSVYIAYLAVIYLAMPANPDPVKMPAEVVWTFRALSLSGLVLFWGVMGGVFQWLSSVNRH